MRRDGNAINNIALASECARPLRIAPWGPRTAKSIDLAPEPSRLASLLLSQYLQYAPSTRLAIRAPGPRSSTDLAIRGPLRAPLEFRRKIKGAIWSAPKACRVTRDETRWALSRSTAVVAQFARNAVRCDEKLRPLLTDRDRGSASMKETHSVLGTSHRSRHGRRKGAPRQDLSASRIFASGCRAPNE